MKLCFVWKRFISWINYEIQNIRWNSHFTIKYIQSGTRDTERSKLIKLYLMIKWNNITLMISRIIVGTK